LREVAVRRVPEQRSARTRATTILSVFGTRPEVIKLAPVIQQLERLGHCFRTINVTSGQHKDLLYPFIEQFGLRIDYNLNAMALNQTPNALCARILSDLDPILDLEEPDLVLVQGDTTTSLAGALAAFHRRIPVGHVEAGMRSGNVDSPYPEEMNRVLITRLASYHFAATSRNRDLLFNEGVTPEKILVTGNPIVDALNAILENSNAVSESVSRLLRKTHGLKRIVVTTHRRESFGDTLAENLRALRQFVEKHDDLALIFPVHPNPNVKALANEILKDGRRIILSEPLNYHDFIHLVSHSWLIVSDSGGIQEEAPSLGKPLLIIRENTERPEALEAGIARLVGGCPKRLTAMLEEAYRAGSWVEAVAKVQNPFGLGDSGTRIANGLASFLGVKTSCLVNART
jgi:UDP-N-acetylglucosamine 2-epimerase (non-hydrolysing)